MLKFQVLAMTTKKTVMWWGMRRIDRSHTVTVLMTNITRVKQKLNGDSRSLSENTSECVNCRPGMVAAGSGNRPERRVSLRWNEEKSLSLLR
jgi:hypothetical protein